MILKDDGGVVIFDIIHILHERLMYVKRTMGIPKSSAKNIKGVTVALKLLNRFLLGDF